MLPPWIQSFAQLLAETTVTDRSGQALSLEAGFESALAHLLALKGSGHKALVLGNGGSAAIAAHVQTDLAHSAKLRALVLHEPSLLTAQANDHGYEHAFRNLTELWIEGGDLLLGISSSGRSPNILAAATLARARGAFVLTFTGFGEENPLRALGDLNFYVQSPSYGAVESAHAVLLHQLTDRLLATLQEGAQS